MLKIVSKTVAMQTVSQLRYKIGPGTFRLMYI